MRLDRLILRDFLTYDFLDYSFPSTPLLIQGLNLTDDGQQSNGSGKSGLQTGIEFCMTASNSRGVRDKDLISFGKESSNIQLYASCDVRSETIHIDWLLNIKGSNKLSLRKKENGKDWVEISFSNVNDGKKIILDWFDIEKDDLFNYFLINKSRFKSFFKSSNKDKVDLVNRFSDASIVDGLEKINEENVISLENQELKKTSKINSIKGKLEYIDNEINKELSRDFDLERKEKENSIEKYILTLNNKINDYKKNIKKNNENIDEIKDDISEEKNTILDIEDEIKEKEKELIDSNKSIEKIKGSVIEANKLIDDFKKTNWDDEKSNYLNQEKDLLKKDKSIEKIISELKSKEHKINELINKISIDLSGSIECPSCSHKFILNNNESIDDLTSKQNSAKDLLGKINDKVDGLKLDKNLIKNSIDKLYLELHKINKKEEVENNSFNDLQKSLNYIESKLNSQIHFSNIVERAMDDLKDERSACELSIKDLEINIKDEELVVKQNNNNISLTNDTINEKREEIKNLSLGNNRETINNLKKDKDKLSIELSNEQDDLMLLKDDILNQKKWNTNFKSFKMFIANRSLETIQGHCNRFLSEMGSDLKIIFEGYKVLSTGKIKDEITTHILRDSLKPFSSFSGGEQGRLLFASILANRYMINNTHKYGGLDFLSIDEVFEGVDDLGLKNIINSAKDLKICVMFITHATSENISDNILKITKTNGISSLKEIKLS